MSGLQGAGYPDGIQPARPLSLARHAQKGSYPDAHFFEIVRQEGVRVLIGVDAHEPEEIRNPAQWKLASRELEPFGALFEDHLCL